MPALRRPIQTIAQPLAGVVRRVEPSGFTKVSALGVEEQRVNVIINFADPPAPAEQAGQLGDSYRVEARIITWQDDDVLKVPASALFRHGSRWAVFVARDGQARLRPVEVGHQTPREAQIVDGLAPGEQVILYPSDELADGVAIQPRRGG